MGEIPWPIFKLESNKRPVPPVVDGLHDDTEIAGMFAKKYMALFSSVKTDPSVMASFLGGILNDIQNDGTNEAPVTVEDVTRLFQKLKYQKADGLSGAQSDHFIYASHRFKMVVAVMLNSMFVHGHTPTILLKSVLCNIPKDLRVIYVIVIITEALPYAQPCVKLLIFLWLKRMNIYFSPVVCNLHISETFHEYVYHNYQRNSLLLQ